MPFCTNCGKKLQDGARFCATCGNAVDKPDGSNPEQRKQEYAGKLIKCPSCGEVLHSYQNICPACRHELRGVSSSDSVRDFTRRLEQAVGEEQQVVLIRNFPIPNAKEDILDFMIIAASNIKSETDKENFDAWIAKFEQAYQKARLLLKDDSFFEEIQSTYDQTCKTIQYGKAKRFGMAFGKSTGQMLRNNIHVLPNIIACTAWIISLFVLISLCKEQSRETNYQVFLFFDFVAGVIVVPFIARCKSSIPRLIITIGLAASIAVLIPLCNDTYKNPFNVLLFFDIVATVIILPLIFFKRHDQ